MYIDPAATSYLIQIIVGLIATIGVVIGVFWKKIRVYFRDRKIAKIEKESLMKANKKD